MPSFLHSGDIGDIIYSLPIVKLLGGGTYYLVSRPEITRPMTSDKFESLKALLEAQPYIDRVEMHKGQKVTHDFTGFRACYTRKRTLVEAQAIHVCPNKIPDSSTPWIIAPKPEMHGRPVIARSPRYHNAEWDSIWPEIRALHPDAFFIGLKEEHAAFEKEFGDIEHRKTNTLLDIANIIAGSPIFIGNQSSPYAIAEAMKHNTIQETHQVSRDCIFPRKNAKHIEWRKQWEEIHTGGDTVMMLMLQVCPLDVYQAVYLARLIADIEPRVRNDIEFVISYRRDTNIHAIHDIHDALKSKFPNIKHIKCQRRGVGWPNGCNDLWQGGMDSVLRMHRDGQTKAECVLTFEPDCLPLRPDWINVLKAEWRRAKAAGKVILGHHHDGHGQNGPPTHINGNAVFAVDILSKHSTLGNSDSMTGWDVSSGKLMMAIGLETSAIHQLYRIKEITRKQVEDIRKNGTIPALFHGIKTPDGLKHVREMIADGTFAARAGSDTSIESKEESK